MLKFPVSIACALLLVAGIVFAEENDVIDIEAESQWADFKSNYGKFYESEAVEARRRFIFEANQRRIEKHNAEADQGLHSYSQGINEFSDLTNDEFKARFRLFKRPLQKQDPAFVQPPSNIDIRALPTSVDWRKKNAVTPIIDQGQCGSSWAFGATGSMEGQHAIKTGKLVTVSAQQLIDCSTAQGNDGCNGGLMNQSFIYVIQNHGIDSNEAYPYEAQDGKCRFLPNKVVATITSYKNVISQNETALQVAIATVGPVAIAVDASQTSFESYKSGVYKDSACNSLQPDHGALIVGYGVDPKEGPYWILKNTWGTSWGMNGYMLIARNANNMCGIATDASYVLA